MSEFMMNDNFLIGDTIYIIGHTNPDMDAIVSAYAYQEYRHAQGDFNYLGVRAGDPNVVTKWAFERFGVNMPGLVMNVQGKKIALVDHTDPDQRAAGWEDAEILEVLDHHKLKLETTAPPKITIRPYGSTSTLVSRRMMDRNMNIKSETAGLMLAAILDDTLALRSPITTYVDKVMAGRLAVVSSVDDLGQFAQDLFEAKDVWKDMEASEVFGTDVKTYEMGGRNIQIAQVETIDNERLLERADEFKKHMENDIDEDDIDIRIMLLTNLIENDCYMITVGEKAHELSEIFDAEFKDGVAYLPGVVSRKKQVEAPMEKFYKNKD